MIGKRTWLVTDFGEIELTNDEHILRNLNWTDPRIRVEYFVVPGNS